MDWADSVDFLGKGAVVTGAASGIGLAATKLFAEKKANVLAIDVDKTALEEAVGRLAPAVATFAADVTDEGAMAAAMARAAELFGGIDVLIANAGIFGIQKPIVEAPVDNFERVMHVNVTGVLVTLKTGAPYLAQRGGGSIIITSSAGAVIGNSEAVAYTASKHALTGIMKVAAREMAAQNIRVNTVNPGLVDTPMMRVVEKEVGMGDPEKGRQMLLQGTFLKRFVQPEEVAQLMLFLASPAALNCTGGMYMIDGGMQYGGGAG